MTLPSILTLSFWFSPTPPPLLPFFDRFLLVVPLVMAVLGAAILVYSLRADLEKMLRRAIGDVGIAGLWLGLTGLLLYSFSYERVPYLGMRVLWVLWFGWVLYEKWKIWKRFSKEIPAMKAARAERERIAKWLPKGK